MILITGSTGYMGSQICKKFEKLKIKYIGINNLKYTYREDTYNKKKFINSIDGLVTIYSLVDIIFQNNFLIKFNLGIPEILRINFVSIFNNFIITRGNEVIRCAIKKSGLFILITLMSGKKQIRNITT